MRAIRRSVPVRGARFLEVSMATGIFFAVKKFSRPSKSALKQFYSSNQKINETCVNCRAIQSALRLGIVVGEMP